MAGLFETREKEIIELFDTFDLLSVEQVKNQLKLSERMVRTLLKSIRQAGPANGFELLTVRGEGYRLLIQEQEKFAAYKNKLSLAAGEDVSNKQRRIPLILYFLLQQEDYISLEKAARLIDVSRATLMRDLDSVREILAAFGLSLQTKAHFGIRIEGAEFNFRKAFNRFVLESPAYTAATQAYMEFCRDKDLSELENTLTQLLEKYQLSITKNAVNSIVDHIRVLLFRISRFNFITDLTVDESILDDKYIQVASGLIKAINAMMDMDIPDTEQLYLASQIAAKTSVEQVPEAEKRRILEKIHHVLLEIDNIYQTSFSQDAGLEDALLLHIYPLLIRISFDMELRNPLVDMVSTQYANVFLVALRFSELWEELNAFSLSRDEVGYLALHFATHLERKRQDVLTQIRRILVISDSHRANIYLIKTKLESEFPHAIVNIIHPAKVVAEYLKEADLILSTTSYHNMDGNYPVIQIGPMLHQPDLLKLKEQILVSSNGLVKSKTFSLKKLFFPELFQRLPQNMDYLEVLEQQCNHMVSCGFASENFAQSVLQREKHFTTIYQNGIAGPHSMEHYARINSIGIGVFPKTILYCGQEVKIIFLINIRKGSLFIHQEISNFFLTLIEQRHTIQKLQRCSSYEDFLHILAPLL